MTITEWIKKASMALQAQGITSAKLDAELIMSHTIRKNRTYLHAHGDEQIDSRYIDILDTRLSLRLDRTPLAYIIGHKEFYGRNFTVTPSTLIPRPESETMIDLLKEDFRQPQLPLSSEAPKLVDVGTGSGCLGITAKLELPELDVTLLDSSRHALNVAEVTAKRLGAEVTLLRSNLLQGYPFEAQYILANLPYVSKEWEVSPETEYEPERALYAGNGGLALIYRLLEEAPGRLAHSGTLLIEADPRQHDAVIKKATDHGMKLSVSRDFIMCFHLS